MSSKRIVPKPAPSNNGQAADSAMNERKSHAPLCVRVIRFREGRPVMAGARNVELATADLGIAHA
jgi:hypothetical protein